MAHCGTLRVDESDLDIPGSRRSQYDGQTTAHKQLLYGSSIGQIDTAENAAVVIMTVVGRFQTDLLMDHQCLVGRLGGIAVWFLGAMFVIDFRRIDSQVAYDTTIGQTDGVAIKHTVDPDPLIRKQRVAKETQHDHYGVYCCLCR